MHRFRLTALCCVAMFATPCAGQVAATAVTPSAAFDTFLRTAAFTGRSPDALAAHWPMSLPQSGHSDIFLSAAHLLSVNVERGMRSSDSTVIGSVTLLEYVADTLALSRRIAEVMGKLQSKHGAPDLCTTPLGPPSYLFTSQTVERVWSKGVANLQTQLEWWRTMEGKMGITIIVSKTPDSDSRRLQCSTKMP